MEARHLGDDRPVYALDWPAERKTTKITFSNIAVQCVASMRRMQPTGPYQLGGHCFGATVAFAIANLLKSQGERTSFLALLDPPDPTFRSDKNRFSDRVRYHLGKMLNQSSPLSAMTYLWQRITNVRRRTLGTFRGEGGPDIYRDFAPNVFPGRITIVLAKDTFLSERPEDDPRMEWRSWAKDGIELIESPGDHITFCREPLVGALEKFASPTLWK